DGLVVAARLPGAVPVAARGDARRRVRRARGGREGALGLAAARRSADGGLPARAPARRLLPADRAAAAEAARDLSPAEGRIFDVNRGESSSSRQARRSRGATAVVAHTAHGAVSL